MDFKRTKLTVLVTAIIATGCSANKLESNTDTQGYCRNGGESSDYSCDKDSQKNNSSSTVSASNPNTEAWMNSKLSDIKSWLKTIKENPNATPPNTSTSNTALLVRNPAANNPELKRIEILTQRGDHRTAMASINNFLAQNPQNLEAELTKGLVLSNMGESAEAESLLRNAITRHPTSPELYNNLAVIYSDKGDYGKAIETLLLAFSTHPSYAQVNENLREVYASVASLAYNRALDLDSDKKQTPELVVLRRISSPSLPAITDKDLSNSIASNTTALPEKKSAVTVKSTPPKAVVKKAAEPVIATAKKNVELVLPVIKEEPSVDIAKIKIKPEPVTAAAAQTFTHKKSVVRVDSKIPAKTGKAPGSSTQAAIKAVNRWSWTWRSQNVNAYLGSYVSNYSPKSSMNHAQWRAQRTLRLTKPAFIKIKLSNIKSKRVSNDIIEVTFLQNYQANTYKDQTNKRLTMKRVGSKWLISKEKNI
jgi:Flp pilus assembly protein TadD